MDLIFEAPGPGTWILDTQHVPVPRPLYASDKARIVGETMNETMARYGLLMVRSSQTINGFMYGRSHTFGVEPGSNDVPSVEDPAIKKRVNRAVEQFRREFWKVERQQWFEEVKPDSIRINLDLA